MRIPTGYFWPKNRFRAQNDHITQLDTVLGNLSSVKKGEIFDILAKIAQNRDMEGRQKFLRALKNFVFEKFGKF